MSETCSGIYDIYTINTQYFLVFDLYITHIISGNVKAVCTYKTQKVLYVHTTDS